jgi:hypothetical protein
MAGPEMGHPTAGNLRGRNTHYRVRCFAGDFPESYFKYVTNGVCCLVGVMRFLQTEWHRHERDRNAWEIERAEMKSRIGKLEGDIRTSKRLNESLGKHVRLLEAALKKEREKNKKLSNNEKVEDTRDTKEIARESINAIKCMVTILDNSTLRICTDCISSSTPQATR